MSKKSRKPKHQTQKAPAPIPTTSSKFPTVVEADAKHEAIITAVPASDAIAQPETSPDTRAEHLSFRKMEPAIQLDYHLEKRKVILRDLEPLAKLEAVDPIAPTQASRDFQPVWPTEGACSVTGEFFRIPAASTEDAIDPAAFDTEASAEDPPEIRRRRSHFRMVIGTVLVGLAALLIVGVARSSQSPQIQNSPPSSLVR